VIVIKLEIPVKRKIAYAVIGAVGTFFVNVIRITMIVAYVMFVSLDVTAFHDVIGEILFLIWVVVYLGLVIRQENKYAAQQAALKRHSRPAQRAARRRVGSGISRYSRNAVSQKS
jgi:thaumarchaeosortase